MFERLLGLITEDNLKKINNAKVLLVGLGGVGGYTLESLIRTGFNNITICDGDVFSKNNLNRQLLANSSNINASKAKEALKHAKLINKDINITVIDKYLKKDNIRNLDIYDYIIDACDDCEAKVELIKYAKENNITIVSAMGTGKRLDPTKVKITRLDKSFNDPLAKKIRILLRKEKIDLKIPIVYSEEVPVNNNKEISSAVFVPATAGIYLAYYVVNDIINKK